MHAVLKSKRGRVFRTEQAHWWVGEIDANDRVSLFRDRGSRSPLGPGEMSYLAFIKRFTRLNQWKTLGHIALSISAMLAVSTCYESRGEELNYCRSVPEGDRIAFAQKAKGDSGVRITGAPATQSRTGGRGRTVKAAWT